ncbi:NAD(P)H-dependent oxidoreductase [Flavobacterium sp. MXW15]|uniref:FMN dependent NADH:quinone oxidoreductase n=1 Tax=Xanthomonas chitinilytica TaxID=2989819 RepID=A0ABT3JYS3_9XANT|nr:NAD(P)H-dependent oxidoreductase [Xanthomonas sp. H13-6]MCW4456034.1 NAD(P)H-dependent oxidoreductase [Flavobacterium sp. MXW15]MCW4473631.1 NAD(P)H-dependent oxidoreductase [Xanthomonas sp. H13-6]
MANLLHIAGSPSGPASHSGSIARELVQAYRESNPTASVASIDVWNLELPDFDAAMIAAKFAVLRSREATDAQRAQWARAVCLSEAFNEADSYVFSLPMWNFGIPYRLKHYIDIVTLPGQNWSWSRAEGYRPLLKNKRAVLVYSSAGDFSPDAATVHEDQQKPFMRQWLRFIGVDVVEEIAVAPTLADPERLLQVKAAAVRQARAAALALGQAQG